MSESCGFFGTATDVRPYTQSPIQRFFTDSRRNGYTYGIGSNLAAVQHSTGDMSVDVGPGEGWIQGCHYASDASVNLSLSAAHASLARIDRIVLRNTIVGTRKITPVVIEGIPAASPVAPSYTRTSDTYDIVLADVAIAAGATAILTENITDQRSDATLCGRSGPLFVRLTDVIPGDALDMNSYKITGSADPSTGGDGVTVTTVINSSITPPTGTPFWYAGATVPSGYIECIGQSVLRADYPTLFSAMGTTFGSVDSTHFTLPDGRGRTIFGYKSTDSSYNAVGKTGGEKTHVLTVNEMPSHVHSGAITAATAGQQIQTSGTNNSALNAVSSSTTGDIGSSAAHSNLQPYLVMKLIVRGV